MAYDRPHLRLVVAGTLYGGPERFSWGLNLMTNFNNAPFDEPETVPTAVRTAVETFWQTANLVSQAAKIDSIKLNLIGENGLYMNPTTVEHVYAPPGWGGQSTALPVPQVALAVSLRTAVDRGLASKGRFFLPLPVAAPASATDPRASIAQATIAVNATTTLINSLNTALTGFVVAVCSPGTENNPQGVSRAVTRVEVGRVLDTIRSRRAQLAEEHVVGAAVTV